MTVENNECRATFRLPKDPERLFDTIDVVRIADSQDLSSVSNESCLNVFGERNARVAFDRDVIVVVNPAQVVEPEMSGQRCSLRCNTFHQAPVTTDCINVVVEDLEARSIVVVGEPFLRDCHADARCRTLPERASCGFNTRHPVVFRMAGSLAVELAEATDIVERDRRLPQCFVVGIHSLNAGEMERRPEQHRGMAVRQHEAIAIGPDRVLRIEFKDTIPYRIDKRRERHWRSGVSGVGLLHGIDGERANRVDAQLIELCGAQILNWSYCGTHDRLRGKYSNSVSRQLRRNCRSLGSEFAGGLFFECGDSAHTSQVAFGLAELGCQKSLDKVPGHHGPDDPATETNDVHVIVLDPLPSREVIIDQSGSDSRNFVGADRSPHAASANSNPALYRA